MRNTNLITEWKYLTLAVKPSACYIMLFNKLALAFFGMVAVAAALPTSSHINNDIEKRGDCSVPSGE